MTSHLCDFCNCLLFLPIQLTACQCILCQPCFRKSFFGRTARMRCPLCNAPAAAATTTADPTTTVDPTTTADGSGGRCIPRLDYVIREAFPNEYATRRIANAHDASTRETAARAERVTLDAARARLDHARAQYDRLVASIDRSAQRDDALESFARNIGLYSIVFVRPSVNVDVSLPWNGLLRDDALFVIELHAYTLANGAIEKLKQLGFRKVHIYRKRYVVGMRNKIRRYAHRPMQLLDATPTPTSSASASASLVFGDALTRVYGDLPRIEVYDSGRRRQCTARKLTEKTPAECGWDRFDMATKRFDAFGDETHRMLQTSGAEHAHAHVRAPAPNPRALPTNMHDIKPHTVASGDGVW